MFIKFRKKPVEIFAYRWDGNWIEFYNDLTKFGTPSCAFKPLVNGDLLIDTLEDGPNKEAKHYASKGDFIIRGVAGEFYACKPEIFEKTYDVV